MEIVPCSKVGHIYKKRNVYSYPKGEPNISKCQLFTKPFRSFVG